MAHFELDDALQSQAKIKVIGVGGGGGNAVDTMIHAGVDGVEFIAVNTDVQALDRKNAPTTLQIGREVTRGLGAGANPEKGRQAALESVTEIGELVEGADMVFITAGMGGGTGTGAAPVIAQVARECGALTVGVVTKPFGFEGRRRMKLADEGIAQLEKAVDTLITIPNQRLLQVTSSNTTMTDAFALAKEVLLHATQGVSDLITVPGIINVDFADVRTIMHEQGRALMGMGVASDEGRAVAAAQQAINSPLLEDVTIQGAQGILMNITAGTNLRLHEVEEAASLIMEAAHEDCNIIFGAVVDETMGDALRLTVIATGFDQHAHTEAELGEAIKKHANLRRQSQSHQLSPAMSALTGQVPGMAPHQPTPAPMHHPVPAPPVYGQAPQGGAYPPAPQAPGASQSNMSGSWSRNDGTADPQEVPAFLRRRPPDSFSR